MNRDRRELGHFLRSRRARITPEHVGIPFGPRRRTPGLRREEIAVLAGLSPTWYAYLEQGRDIRPSPEVLDSLARVLRLTEDERRYLHLLAVGEDRRGRRAGGAPPREDLIPRIVAEMGTGGLPVYGGNAFTDVYAWNDAATRWYTDFGALPPARRNMLSWLLTAPEARERIVDWEDDTRATLANFRLAAAAQPNDSRFTELLALLRDTSPEFRQWWGDHDVRGQQTRSRRVRLDDGTVCAVQLVVLALVDGGGSVVLHVPLDGDGTAAGAGPGRPHRRSRPA